MTTKDLIKTELDNIPEEYLPVLLRIVRAFEEPASEQTATPSDAEEARAWRGFISETYGSLADSPIERGPQGEYELREPIE